MRVDPSELYESYRQQLQPVLDFMTRHARPPRPDELPEDTEQAIMNALGSMRYAVQLIRRVTPTSYWDHVTVQRRHELLIYIALSRFTGRPRFGQLTPTLAIDIRTLFGNYQHACQQADRLLAACGEQARLYITARRSRVGKQTPGALYVHRGALGELPPLLQVYEGCARVLSGTVDDANMVKLSVTQPQVSYLTYPLFDRAAHPTLANAVTVNLTKLTVDSRDYAQSCNPPLLHRKEEFLGEDDPRRELYTRLTRSEMRAGLYEHPEHIGTLNGWLATLARAGVEVRGHRLHRVGNEPTAYRDRA